MSEEDEEEAVSSRWHSRSLLACPSLWTPRTRSEASLASPESGTATRPTRRRHEVEPMADRRSRSQRAGDVPDANRYPAHGADGSVVPAARLTAGPVRERHRTSDGRPSA